MKILVIGGDGFIGGKYCERMINSGHTIFSYDLPKYDILDYAQLQSAVSGAELVIHFAAMANIVECHVQMDKTFEVNIRGTYNVAKACAALKKKMIFISTCCVYGNSLDDLEDEYTTNPQAAEPYAVSKVAGEAIIKGMIDLDYEILRIGTVYGPGQRDALFTAICLNNLHNGENIYIDGDGCQNRQLIYIDDLIDGIQLATEKYQSGHIYNLCGKQKISALDTVKFAEYATGKNAIMVYRKQRYGQTFEENISIERARTELGWEPKTDFLTGMKKAYDQEKYK